MTTIGEAVGSIETVCVGNTIAGCWGLGWEGVSGSTIYIISWLSRTTGSALSRRSI